MNAENLAREIRSRSEDSLFPDGKTYRTISVREVLSIEEAFGISGRKIEIASLENGIVPNRYARNLNAYSILDQLKLLRSTAAVVGLGGLGGGVVEILARIGVGCLILVDGDRFEDTNLNRQFLSRPERIDTGKAAAAAERVLEINQSVQTCKHEIFLSRDNAENLLVGADVIVDCLDSVKTRFLLEKAAKKLKIPLVSSAVAGASGQVMTIFPEDPGLSGIFGDPGQISDKGAEKTLGCLPQAVLLLSALECSEAVKILTGRGNLLRHRLLLVDMADNTFDLMQLG